MYHINYVTSDGEIDHESHTKHTDAVLDVLKTALRTLAKLPPGAKIEITFEVDHEQKEGK